MGEGKSQVTTSQNSQKGCRIYRSIYIYNYACKKSFGVRVQLRTVSESQFFVGKIAISGDIAIRLFHSKLSLSLLLAMIHQWPCNRSMDKKSVYKRGGYPILGKKRECFHGTSNRGPIAMIVTRLLPSSPRGIVSFKWYIFLILSYIPLS